MPPSFSGCRNQKAAFCNVITEKKQKKVNFNLLSGVRILLQLYTKLCAMEEKKENGVTGARLHWFCRNSCLDADLENKQKHRSALPCGYVAQYSAWQARSIAATAFLRHQIPISAAQEGEGAGFSQQVQCVLCVHNTLAFAFAAARLPERNPDTTPESC